MTSTHPLRAPDYEPLPPGPVEFELRLIRRVLAETAPLNIHSHNDMLQAAVLLDCRARALVAALDAEQGERR
ncbi:MULTISPECIES: hypothetical protein [Streptomyces]|uniref:hypothetical protein n=1 Tax=Streptomyces TaxID=1883 RepID=UPI0033FF5A3F